MAQVRFGIKAGFNLPTWNVSNVSGISYSIRPDLNAGVISSVSLNYKFSLEPEILYSGQGVNIKTEQYTGTYYNQFINVPVIVKYEIIKGLAVETGPQTGLLLSAKKKLYGGILRDAKAEFKIADFGWAFGASYLLQRHWGFDARYNLGLTNLADPNAHISIKNRVFQVGIFYFI